LPVYFFDTSALVKRYVQEVGTNRVRSITDSTAQNIIYIAEITGAEVMAAITKRMRTTLKDGGISKSDGNTAIKEFRDDFENHYMVIEITSDVISRAMDLTEIHKLRGYDAVQLAVALKIDSQLKAMASSAATATIAAAVLTLTIVSADDELNTAAIAEGLTLEDPRSYP
jgi:uncharacterized protein